MTFSWLGLTELAHLTQLENTMELVILAVVALAVVYKLGLFTPVVRMTNVAIRESDAYDREHKKRVARRYLAADNEFSEEEIAKINGNIKAIDELEFD